VQVLQVFVRFFFGLVQDLFTISLSSLKSLAFTSKENAFVITSEITLACLSSNTPSSFLFISTVKSIGFIFGQKLGTFIIYHLFNDKIKNN
jgi:hypothetical protein